MTGRKSQIKCALCGKTIIGKEKDQPKERQTPAVLTTDFLYLRFIGERIVREDDFRRIETDICLHN